VWAGAIGATVDRTRSSGRPELVTLLEGVDRPPRRGHAERRAGSGMRQ